MDQLNFNGGNTDDSILKNLESEKERLKLYMQKKYDNKNITTLLNMVETVIRENNELRERLVIVEQILHMHLPIIEKS